jgi:hypothetical protein
VCLAAAASCPQRVVLCRRPAMPLCCCCCQCDRRSKIVQQLITSAAGFPSPHRLMPAVAGAAGGAAVGAAAVRHALPAHMGRLDEYMRRAEVGGWVDGCRLPAAVICLPLPAWMQVRLCATCAHVTLNLSPLPLPCPARHRSCATRPPPCCARGRSCRCQLARSCPRQPPPAWCPGRCVGRCRHAAWGAAAPCLPVVGAV